MWPFNRLFKKKPVSANEPYSVNLRCDVRLRLSELIMILRQRVTVHSMPSSYLMDDRHHKEVCLFIPSTSNPDFPFMDVSIPSGIYVYENPPRRRVKVAALIFPSLNVYLAVDLYSCEANVTYLNRSTGQWCSAVWYDHDDLRISLHSAELQSALQQLSE